MINKSIKNMSENIFFSKHFTINVSYEEFKGN
jgi:hypothetical protein